MNMLLTKAVAKEAIEDRDIEYALFEICDREHSSCNDECPVYEKNRGPVNPHRSSSAGRRGCDCFKNGPAMLKFLRS
jgi:hypothetical protein